MAKKGKTEGADPPNTLKRGAWIYFEDDLHPEGIFCRFTGYDEDSPLQVVLQGCEVFQDAETLNIPISDLLLKKNLKSAHTLQELEKKVFETDDFPESASKLVDENALPEELLKKADNIIHIVKTVEERVSRAQEMGAWKDVYGKSGRFSYTKAVEKALNELRQEPNPKGFRIPDPTYYFTWRRIYRKHHGVRSVIAGLYRRDTYNQSKFPKIVFDFLGGMITKFYRADLPIDKKTFIKNAKSILDFTGGYWISSDKCNKDTYDKWEKDLLEKKISKSMIEDSNVSELFSKVELPGRSWLYGFLRAFERNPDENSKMLETKFGKDFWERNFLIFEHFIQIAQYPLHYVFADHYLIDLWGVDDETRSKKFRLWLTVLVDCYSRCIIGVYLDESYPSIESIQGVLYDGVWPKEYQKKYGIELDWIAHGIPIHLFIDNAWAHLSLSLENLASIISQDGEFPTIDIVKRPPYKARYGAIIESLFANFAHDLRERLKTAIRENEVKENAFSENNACLLFDDIKKIILQLVLEHQHRPLKSLNGKTPHEKWIERLKARFIKPFPKTDEIERQFWQMYHDPRTVSDKGVRIFDNHYLPNSRYDTANHLSRSITKLPRVDSTGATIKYTIRFNKGDIFRIAIFKEGTGEWQGDFYAKEFSLANGDYRHRSLAEHKAINRDTREKIYENTVGIDHIADANAVEESRAAEQKAIQKQLRAASRNSKKPEEIDFEAIEKAYLEASKTLFDDI